jgi:hypothetical protein
MSGGTIVIAFFRRVSGARTTNVSGRCLRWPAAAGVFDRPFNGFGPHEPNAERAATQVVHRDHITGVDGAPGRVMTTWLDGSPMSIPIGYAVARHIDTTHDLTTLRRNVASVRCERRWCA